MPLVTKTLITSKKTFETAGEEGYIFCGVGLFANSEGTTVDETARWVARATSGGDNVVFTRQT